MRLASLWVKLYILSLLTQCLSQNNGPKDWQRNCRLYLKCQDHQNKINPHMREHLLAFTFIYVTFLLLDGLWTTIHCLQMSPTSVFYPHNNIFYFFSGLTSPYYMAAKNISLNLNLLLIYFVYLTLTTTSLASFYSIAY